MNILVIPDLHGRKFWREAIKNNIGKVDKIVFLGDYLDPYPIEIAKASTTIEKFDRDGTLLGMLYDITSLKRYEPDKYILLTGNHTDAYIWPEFSASTRVDKYNWEKYHNFFLDNLTLFNLVYIQNNVIFSHAGITKSWAEEVWKELNFPENEQSSIKEIAQTFQDTPLLSFDKNYINLISNISYYRGGLDLCGSCEWADIREHVERVDGTNIIGKGEEGIYQIFGHTQLVQQPVICDKWACLDCRKPFIVNTNTFEIEDGSTNSI